MDLPPTINLPLVVAMIIIAVAVVITIYTKSRPVKNPPAFCRQCGCPIKEWWHTTDKEFSETTGLGTMYQEKHWHCSKDNYHYDEKSGESRVKTIDPDCEPE